MPISKCCDCYNLIKAEVKQGGNGPALWACTHPLRAPISCYTGMKNGVLGYQNSDCPDRSPGECHHFEFNKEHSAELRELKKEYGDYGNEYLARGVSG